MQTGILTGHPKSADIFTNNRNFIPGGVMSVNRATQRRLSLSEVRGHISGMQTEISTLIIMLRSRRISLDTTIPTSRTQ